MRIKGQVSVAKPRLFYGWWIVIAGTLATMLSATFSYYGFSAFFPAIVNEFGWSRTAISGAFSLSRIESGLLGPIEGYLIQRLGVRRMMIAGVAILSLGYILFSQVKSLPTFYLVIIFGIVLGGSLGFHMPISFAIANWFRRKRGKAFGIFKTGPGLSGLLVPLLGLLIVTLGWRDTAVVAGLSMLVLGFPLVFVMRDRPQDHGLFPDGDPIRDATSSIETPQRKISRTVLARQDDGFTTSQALRTPAFWFLSVAMMVTVIATSGVLIHFVVMLQDRGINVAIGSTLLGAVALMSIPGRLGFSWLSDYLNKHSLLASLMAVLGVAIFFMSQAENMALFSVFTAVFAITYGGAVTVIDPLRADYFGMRNFATIMGCMRLIQAIGNVVGPLLAGVIYDLTNSYTIALIIFAGCASLGALSMFLSKKPVLPEVSK
ncbi:MFS transporter [Chloroflexota bacterium]